MKKTIVFVVFTLVMALYGICWEMNPLSWTFDADSRTLQTDGTSPFALADALCAERRTGAGCYVS